MPNTLIDIDTNGTITIHPSTQVKQEAIKKAKDNSLQEAYLLEVIENLDRVGFEFNRFDLEI